MLGKVGRTLHTVTVLRKSARSNSQAGCQRSLWIKLRRVKIDCPPAWVQDIPEGWARLARVLKAEIDPDLIEAYRGTVSLPFEPGKHRRIAVKIVDDRGTESLEFWR